MLARQLGEEAKDQLDQLEQITKLLEEAGLVERKGDQLELTPRAIRKIGQKALKDIFQHLAKDRFGNHEADHRGRGGDRSDDTKAYEFGDPFLLDLKETVMNAVERTGPGVEVLARVVRGEGERIARDRHGGHRLGRSRLGGWANAMRRTRDEGTGLISRPRPWWPWKA